MLKKLILIIGLFVYTNILSAAVEEAVPLSSPMVAIGAANAANITAQESAHSSYINSVTASNTPNLDNIPTGVMECKDNYYSVPGGYVVDGCNQISINDFFNRYKPSNAHKIVMIIFDEHVETFYIYYN